MCGICGVYRFGDSVVTEAQIRRMCSALVHRGPDEEGMHVHGNLGLGIRRLKVIDLETGSQPVSNENGSVTVVFNGEIFNYRELRDELEARGHRFTTRSDTEVIVHAYEDEGPDFVHRLNGMFAIALWDASRETLLLYRDRLGVKPLFYAIDGNRLAFGSEIKAILALDDIPRRVNLQGLCDYLAFQYVAPPDTIFEGIRKLPPGHTLRIRGTEWAVAPYWRVPEPCPEPMDEEECAERVRDLLSDAVRLRLVSDVPLGVFLSGGIDSSILTALAADHMDRPVKTFSMGFAESSFNELPHAQSVAERYWTEHHAFMAEAPDLAALLPELVWYYDEPFGDSSAIPTFMLSRKTREHVTVALSGEGGDELFGGYRRYLGTAWEPAYGWVPRILWRGASRLMAPFAREGTGYAGRAHQVRRFLQAAQRPPAERYLSMISIFSRDARERLLAASVNGLNRASDEKFLNAYVEYAGHVVSDPAVVQSVRKKRPFLLAAPSAPASECVRALARTILAPSKRPVADDETRPGFFERLWGFFAREI
jgi:asparagine synthase (glutamine-hydrolysing)